MAHFDLVPQWTKDGDTEYKITRTTVTLSTESSIDYTADVCAENSADTQMSYCYINEDSESCLPTENGLCSNSNRCLNDEPSRGYYYIYDSDNTVCYVDQDSGFSPY